MFILKSFWKDVTLALISLDQSTFTYFFLHLNGDTFLIEYVPNMQIRTLA